ncbi:hypothetical protein DVDV_1232 [Desulfovibrio sp. DV]|uniref:hypothetical protein n=1 Tax=Desulfovibrio sp. DV TaxID=1844708 RepID=UPI000965D344|nr:hypothetical protein [Desulfovibrio sp. DV]OLN29234.1 hypothetical protein DVDV_1232 [Desulfovibrio sp. DV]
MADKDIKDIAHCVYMIDLVLREIMHSASITKKDFATQCIIDSFVRILREEGYSVTPARLKKCSPTPIDSQPVAWHTRLTASVPGPSGPGQTAALAVCGFDQKPVDAPDRGLSGACPAVSRPGAAP